MQYIVLNDLLLTNMIVMWKALKTVSASSAVKRIIIDSMNQICRGFAVGCAIRRIPPQLQVS